jgi:squalene-hopene/tetraprenyl-beta-curcumene cyclase
MNDYGVLAKRIDAAAETAAASLFDRQRADGSWQDTLPSAATATGSAVIALTLADREGSSRLIEGGARWLRANQDRDGGWGEAPGAPATINATAMAVAALQFVAAEESAQVLRRGLDRIEGMGGLAVLDDLSRSSLGPVCQQYLALVGWHDEHTMTRIPVELSLFPRAIQRRYCFSFPGLMSWGLMQARLRKANPLRRAINRLAEPRALDFLESVVRFEGADGGFEESPLMVALVCIGLTRAGLGRDIVDHCVRYLQTTVRADGSWAVTRDLEFTSSALLTVGLHETGFSDDPRLARTAQWIRDCQMTAGFQPTGCPPGGWQWSQPSGWPGSLDTADGVAALAGFRPGDTSAPGARASRPADPGSLEPADDNIRRGVRWLLDMQNGDGSWSYFCRNSRLPVDSPCSLMTAHAMIALRSATGMTPADRPLARAVEWISRALRPDGAIATAWYMGLTAGTGSSLAALGRLGLAGGTAARMRDWLLDHQNDDGGWGDGGGGPSTVEETSWALLGLADSAPAADHQALVRGAEWLIDKQGTDGLWEPALVGLYMHNLLFASDHFANGYALQALGRTRRRLLAQAAP